MIELYSAPQNLFFSVALTLMFLIGLTQIISVTFGLGLDGVLDDLLPDFDADIDVDLDADAGAHADMGMMGGIMGWLHIGKVPLLISLSFFLLFFAFIGYGAQIFCYNLGIGFLSRLGRGSGRFLRLPSISEDRQSGSGQDLPTGRDPGRIKGHFCR